jgi:membrane protein implicated in regulation of membrane protease activity
MDAQWLQPWHWFVLAGVILIIEVFGVGGFFLGAGLAALIVAIASLIIEWSWQWQVFVFAVLAVVFTVIYYKKFRRFNLTSEQPDLNSGSKRYIGREFTVLHDSINQRTKIQIGDALWTVVIQAKQGQRIRIINAEGLTLYAELLDEQNN